MAPLVIRSIDRPVLQNSPNPAFLPAADKRYSRVFRVLGFGFRVYGSTRCGHEIFSSIRGFGLRIHHHSGLDGKHGPSVSASRNLRLPSRFDFFSKSDKGMMLVQKEFLVCGPPKVEEQCYRKIPRRPKLHRAKGHSYLLI